MEGVEEMVAEGDMAEIGIHFRVVKLVVRMRMTPLSGVLANAGAYMDSLRRGSQSRTLPWTTNGLVVPTTLDRRREFALGAQGMHTGYTELEAHAG